ncbi:MAG: penicillin acylase family protein [Acidobacteria bacterium]|nr:penicillin acylase family protein [Acidobacteriota bacterium]
MSNTTENNTEIKPQKSRLIVRLLLVFFLLVFASTLVLAIATKVTYDSWTKNAISQTDGELKVKGVSQEVRVIRDKWGVPYVTAKNINDLAFAQGYVTAQDRLWQMDLLRRAAKGELSAVLGAGDKNSTLEVDKLHRSLGLKRTVEKDLPKLPKQLQQMLSSYSQGVNAYIESHKDKLPLEFNLLGYKPDLWQPIDSLVVGKLMAISLTGTWKFDLMRAEMREKLDPKVYKMFFDESSQFNQPVFDLNLVKNDPLADKNEKVETKTASTSNNLLLNQSLPKLPKIEPELFAQVQEKNQTLSDLILSSNEAMIGSNNWVVSGKLTDTGKPLLANDPHQGLSLPAIWYQVHLRAIDGSYAAAGVSIIGAPGIVIGHNDYIAWGATNVMADVQDVYVEEFDQSNPTRYLVGSEWRDAEVIKDKIQVRESILSSKTSAVDHDIVITRHGPIVSSVKGQKLALRWAGVDAPSEFLLTFSLNQARNWDEFCSALKNAAVPLINYVYADKEGNIGYYAVGRIPIRATGNGSLPYDGRTEDGEWKGYIPFEELPHLYNPENGYIATANQKLVSEKYPYTIANDWAPPYRGHRIYQLLSEKNKFTFEDMHNFQADVYAIPTKFFADQVVKMAANHKDDPVWQEIEKELKDWDGNLTVKSRAATIAVTMRKHFTEDFFTSWLGELRPSYTWYLRGLTIDRAITNWSTEFLPSKYKDFDTMVVNAYNTTVKELNTTIGSDRNSWEYGRINRFSFNHPIAKISVLKSLLNSDQVIVGGSAHTLNCNDTNADRIWGPSMRMVISLDSFDKTTLSIVPGASGQVASPHYLDQINDWVALQPHAFVFSKESIGAMKGNSLLLVPAR